MAACGWGNNRKTEEVGNKRQHVSIIPATIRFHQNYD